MKRFVVIFVCTAVLVCTAWTQTATSNVIAKQFYESGDFLSALVAYLKVVSDPKAPERDEALLGSAKTYFALLDYENASKNLDILFQKFPKSSRISDALYWKGRVLLAQEKPEAALEQFDVYLKRFPAASEASNALFWMAEALTDLGHYETAAVFYERLILAYPKSYKIEAARYRLAVIKYDQREEKLLDLLRWSSIESINAADEYQRREKVYQNDLLAFQKRLSGGSGDDMAAQILSLQKENHDKDALIQTLRAKLTDGTGKTSSDAAEKLGELRSQALDLKVFFLEWRLTHDKP